MITPGTGRRSLPASVPMRDPLGGLAKKMGDWPKKWETGQENGGLAKKMGDWPRK